MRPPDCKVQDSGGESNGSLGAPRSTLWGARGCLAWAPGTASVWGGGLFRILGSPSFVVESFLPRWEVPGSCQPAGGRAPRGSRACPTHDPLSDLGQVPAPIRASVSLSEQLREGGGPRKLPLLPHLCLPTVLRLCTTAAPPPRAPQEQLRLQSGMRVTLGLPVSGLVGWPGWLRVPPPPLPFSRSPAPGSHTGGGGGVPPSQGGYSRGGGWKAAFCHRALELPHQDSSGDRPPSTLLRWEPNPSGNMCAQGPGLVAVPGGWRQQ